MRCLVPSGGRCRYGFPDQDKMRLCPGSAPVPAGAEATAEPMAADLTIAGVKGESRNQGGADYHSETCVSSPY